MMWWIIAGYAVLGLGTGMAMSTTSGGSGLDDAVAVGVCVFVWPLVWVFACFALTGLACEWLLHWVVTFVNWVSNAPRQFRSEAT